MINHKGKNNPMYGKTHSEETKRKLSEANKGYVHTKERNKKISKANNGKKNGMYGRVGPNKGKHLSEETKLKISIAHKGLPSKLKGRRRSKITKLKMSKALHKHHFDLNKQNNKQTNIALFTNGNHQNFHRFAYHYLLEKFGIKEIMKYYEWFKINREKKED